MTAAAPTDTPAASPQGLTLFLAGDVMLGRGIDQILPHPGDPRLYEGFMHDARGYVRLAEARNGPIPRGARFDYVWGDLLPELARLAPAFRIVNLETSVTAAGSPEWKGINYRMHPENVGSLLAAGVDCCVLANNHVLDWGEAGLADTLSVLAQARIATAGAGLDQERAEAPAVLERPGRGRTLVYAFAVASSGVPPAWAARPGHPGVAFLADASEHSLGRVGAVLARDRRPGDVTLVSLHWGANWGYEIPPEQRGFAHRLIRAHGVDVVFGHSSHHPLGIEVYRGRPILYGAGDLINDYEGITDNEEYRGDLTLAYFLELDAAGHLLSLCMAPFRINRFRLSRASSSDASWLAGVLAREGGRLGTRVRLAPDGSSSLEWRADAAAEAP
jgi:poly-gamma-glutamate synthesis protein (capsule biosynthesis protein)